MTLQCGQWGLIPAGPVPRGPAPGGPGPQQGQGSTFAHLVLSPLAPLSHRLPAVGPRGLLRKQGRRAHLSGTPSGECHLLGAGRARGRSGPGGRAPGTGGPAADGPRPRQLLLTLPLRASEAQDFLKRINFLSPEIFLEIGLNPNSRARSASTFYFKVELCVSRGVFLSRRGQRMCCGLCGKAGTWTGHTVKWILAEILETERVFWLSHVKENVE